MYRYIICNVADEDIFSRQCRAIEKYLRPQTDERLEDVDGSVVQKYRYEGHTIKVVNSLYVNCVYVESEIDIRPYFHKKRVI